MVGQETIDAASLTPRVNDATPNDAAPPDGCEEDADQNTATQAGADDHHSAPAPKHSKSNHKAKAQEGGKGAKKSRKAKSSKLPSFDPDSCLQRKGDSDIPGETYYIEGVGDLAIRY